MKRKEQHLEAESGEQARANHIAGQIESLGELLAVFREVNAAHIEVHITSYCIAFPKFLSIKKKKKKKKKGVVCRKWMDE